MNDVERVLAKMTDMEAKNPWAGMGGDLDEIRDYVLTLRERAALVQAFVEGIAEHGTYGDPENYKAEAKQLLSE